MDKHLKVNTLRVTPNPQGLCWLAAHNDYSEEYIIDEIDAGKWRKDEKWFGEKVVEKCLKFGHWGVTEHPQITFACGGFPHSVMVQARTHRVAVSFDVQSGRYTSKRFLDLVENAKTWKADKISEELEKVFYLRPVGFYTDRKGVKYEYTEDQREYDLSFAYQNFVEYHHSIKERGFSEEHARGMLPYEYRQNFVVSFTMRSLMHFLDLRAKKDAQLEIQWLAQMFFDRFKRWAPEIASFYEEKRLGKNRVAP